MNITFFYKSYTVWVLLIQIVCHGQNTSCFFTQTYVSYLTFSSFLITNPNYKLELEIHLRTFPASKLFNWTWEMFFFFPKTHYIPITTLRFMPLVLYNVLLVVLAHEFCPSGAAHFVPKFTYNCLHLKDKYPFEFILTFFRCFSPFPPIHETSLIYFLAQVQSLPMLGIPYKKQFRTIQINEKIKNI